MEAVEQEVGSASLHVFLTGDGRHSTVIEETPAWGESDGGSVERLK